MNTVVSILFVALLSVQVFGGEETADGTKRFIAVDTVPHWGTWSPYSACTPSCIGGRKTRTRHCYLQGREVSTNLCNGVVSMQYHTCTQADCYPTNPTPAPTHGVWSHWTGFSTCSVSCGSGHMYRTRVCHGSTPCIGSSKESRSCHHSCSVPTVPAPVDGHWGPWTAYSHCSHSCGHGTQTRHRFCNNPAPSNGGRHCSGYSYTMMACHLHACVVNGGWGTWAVWSSCSTSCDLGTITRHRACNHPAPSNGGNQCSGDTTEMHECSKGPCPVWSHWFEGDCSVSCGNGTMERLRHCSTGRDSDCLGIAYQMVPCSAVQCV